MHMPGHHPLHSHPSLDNHTAMQNQQFLYTSISPPPINLHPVISHHPTTIHLPPSIAHRDLQIPPPKPLPPLPLLPGLPPPPPPLLPRTLMLGLNPPRLLRRLNHHPHEKLTAPKLLRELDPRPRIRIRRPQLPDLLHLLGTEVIFLLVRRAHRRWQPRRRTRGQQRRHV